MHGAPPVSIHARRCDVWPWQRRPLVLLRWDGQRWWCDGQAVHGLQVRIDLQSVLLLELAGAAGVPLWLAVSRRSDPALWLDVRRAAYCRAKPEPAPTPSS